MKSDKIKKDPLSGIIKPPGTGFKTSEAEDKGTKVWPKYLFKPGEKFVHRDEFGNIWYEEIKTK